MYHSLVNVVIQTLSTSSLPTCMHLFILELTSSPSLRPRFDPYSPFICRTPSAPSADLTSSPDQLTKALFLLSMSISNTCRSWSKKYATIFQKCSETLTHYCTRPKIWTTPFNYLYLMYLNASLAEHDMPCLSKQCRSSDLDLHCLSLDMWPSIKNSDQVIWLAGN